MPTTFPNGSVARRQAGVTADVLDSLRALQRLAYLRAELYTRALAAPGFVLATEKTVFDTLSSQETSHVSTLSSLIATRLGTPVPKPTFDFTGKGAVPGFTFAAGQYETFRMLAQAFEDLGVRAYKGQV